MEEQFTGGVWRREEGFGKMVGMGVASWESVRVSCVSLEDALEGVLTFAI